MRETRTRSLLAAAVFAALAVASVLVPVGEGGAVWAVTAGFLVCLVVPAWIRRQRGDFDLFETVNVIGLQYLVFYGLGAVWTLEDPSRVSFDRHLVPYIPLAAFYCLLGYVGFLSGYHAPIGKGRRAALELEPRSIWILSAVAGIGFLGSLGQAALFEYIVREDRVVFLASIAGQLSPLFVFVWAVLWMQFFDHRATMRQRHLLLLMAPAVALVGYKTLQSKATTIVLAAVPLMALWYARRRLPWKTLGVLLIVVVFVIFPFYNRFRIVDPWLPQERRLSIAYEALQELGPGEYLDKAVVGFKARMALVNSVAVAVRDVGRWVPYAKGETLFYPMLAYFVPRVLWPEKPLFTTGFDFGRRFHVVNIADRKTSIAPTVPGELYWNFDLPGIVVGMALWGLALGWLYHRYGSTPGLDPLRRAVHMALLVQFTHFDGGIAGHSIGVIRNVLLCELVIWLLRKTGGARAVS